MNRTKLPQRGAVTHHHDQSMTWVSFNTRNTKNNRPPNPIPELLDDDELDIILIFNCFYFFFFI